MCYNCGCAIADDDMGQTDNITEKTLENLAITWGKDLPETKRELLALLLNNDSKLEEEPLKSMFEKAATAWKQSLEEARKNITSLLKNQVR